MKFSKAAIAALLMTFAPGVAQADPLILASPASWRLANYLDGSIVAFFVGSPCPYGQVQLPANSVSSEDRNRFWSLILSEKGIGHNVGIYYETDSGLCRVTSFYGD